LRILVRIFPFLRWGKRINRANLQADIISGLTVALVLIPQSMAYAQLAGLPPYYGLYASLLPPLIAALFGSSRQLATGPVAIVSLMTSASLAPLAPLGSEGYIAYAIILALTVGLFQLSLGLLRLGAVVNFLSHPVVNGFTNGAAIIIATSQLSKLFGVSVDQAEHHYETVLRVLHAAVNYTHWPTFGIGALAFAVMYGLKRLNPRIPYVLVAVVVTTLISWAVGFEHNSQAPLSAFESEDVRLSVEEFNDTVSELDELGLRRSELTPALIEERDKSGETSIMVLEIEHELAIINVDMERLSEVAHETREKLRGILFRAVEEPDGQIRYYEKDRVPEGAKTDGRTWRMKIGRVAIPKEAVAMTGGGAVVGVIPKGLPAFSIPQPTLNDILTLLPYAVVISLLGFMEAISIAKAMAGKTGQFLDPNQELIGQGLANIAGAVGNSYPTSGSFSRSAVNLQSGAVTGISSVTTSVVVLIMLLFFTPLLYYLPQATLAAVIMMAVVGLVSVSSFVHAWKTHRVDGAISIITFICTLVFAPHLDKGISIGIILSLGMYIYSSMKPRVAYLALHPDLSFRDARHWGLKECKHIVMIRYDGNLFFANVSYFEDLVRDRCKSMPELRHIVLVANGINDMDASGEDVLSLVVDNVRSAGIDFSISGVKETVLGLMKRTHLLEKIGEDHIFATQSIAIESLYDEAHKGTDEKECPLLTVCYDEENKKGKRRRQKWQLSES